MTEGTGTTGTPATDHAAEVHREPFEVLARSTLQDSRLTFRARGLLAYMVSMPPGWRFATDRIAAESREGRDAVRAAMRELEAAGYVRRTKRNAGGRGGITTVVEVAARPTLLPPATDSQAPVAQAPTRPAAERAQVESTQTEQPLPLAPLARSSTLEHEPAVTIEPLPFEHFWQVYPRKVGKRAAEKAYAAAVKRAARKNGDPGMVVQGAYAYRDDPNREDAYTAHPSTWLNRDGWLDDPLPERPVTGSTVSRTQGILERAHERAQAAETGLGQWALEGGDR